MDYEGLIECLSGVMLRRVVGSNVLHSSRDGAEREVELAIKKHEKRKRREKRYGRKDRNT